MTCKKCGRDDGHYLGCVNVGEPAPAEADETTAEQDASGESHEMCAFAGCTRMRHSKHHSAKFCVLHKDPKNREI